MSRLFRVKIDLRLVQSNLAREDRREVGLEEVRRFLIDSGFVENGEWWIVSEPALGSLDPSEVTEAEIVDEPPQT